MTLDEYRQRFDEEPGYFDYARVGPIGRAAIEEQSALSEMLARSRFGSLQVLLDQDERMRAAVARIGGFRPDQVVFQPSTSHGLLHVAFGLSGGIALSPLEYPALPYAVTRAAAARGKLSPTWIETDDGRVTPGNLKGQLSRSIQAVAVSLVDHRTGYLADLEGIRQVVRDRLLIVDAVQGFGVVDAPFHLADVVVAGGHTWLRAGIGTGFLAVSDRARERLEPVLSGFAGSADPYSTEVEEPADGARAFLLSHVDLVAAGRLAAALEEVAAVGVPTLNAAIAERVSRIVDLADEFALPVVSPRAESERAGIVVLEPEPAQLTVLAASLHNHGITATVRESTARLSAHATVGEEAFAMLKAALLSFATSV